MKHLTISLLIVYLCFSLLFSCGGSATVDTSNESSGVVQAKNNIKNPIDNLSKEEKIARMNAAHLAQNTSTDPDVSEMVQAKINNKPSKIGADQAEQSSRNMRRKYEAIMDEPTTDREKLIAQNICKCLNNKPLFKSVKNAKTDKEVLKLAGDGKDKEVKALQDCYNINMVPAVNNLGQEAGLFAMKSRTHLNKTCLDGTDKFWIAIGGYLGRKTEKSTIDIDMTKLEKGLIRQQ